MDVFSQFAQVKDISVIKDPKQTGGNPNLYKDFAFIELFTIDDSTYVLEMAKQGRL